MDCHICREAADGGFINAAKEDRDYGLCGVHMDMILSKLGRMLQVHLNLEAQKPSGNKTGKKGGLK